MANSLNIRRAVRPLLLLGAIAAGVATWTFTKPDGTTVVIPFNADSGVADSPPIDTPIDSPPVAYWTMETIYGPAGTVGLTGSDGVDIATISGNLTVVSPWEQSDTITVSTKTGAGVGTWGTVVLPSTVDEVEDAKWCDINGDGVLDVMAAGQGKTIRVWYGPTPFTTNHLIDAATNLELWMQLACTSATSKTFTAANGTDTFTATAHGWSTTDLVRVSNSGGGLPAGLAAATDYYVIRTGANTYKLAASRTLAHAGTAIDITTDGTGTHTAIGGMRVWAAGRGTIDQTFTADAGTDLLTKATHGFSTGDFVRVSNSGGGLPAGLAANTTYYTVYASASTFKLATSQVNAFAGTTIDLTTNGTGTQTVTRLAILAYFQSGSPSTSTAWSYMQIAPVGFAMSLLVGDYDADGDVDVALSERQAGCCAGIKGSKWYRSDAAGAWTASTIYNFAAQGDTKFMEVVNATTVLTGGGSTTAPNKLVRSVTADNWATWTSAEIAPYPSNAGMYQGVVTCDITGDGTPDHVLTHSAATGTLDGVVYIDGVSGVSFTTFTIDEAAGEKYDNAICNDVDGDGDLDVITSEQNTGLGVIWYKNPRI